MQSSPICLVLAVLFGCAGVLSASLSQIRIDRDNVRVRLGSTGQNTVVEATVDGVATDVFGPATVPDPVGITVDGLADGTAVEFREFRVNTSGNRTEVASLTVTAGDFSGVIEDGETVIWDADRKLSFLARVEEGGELIISPGVRVESNTFAQRTLTVFGRVSLFGTAESPITLSRVRIDSGGDSDPGDHHAEHVVFENNATLQLHNPTFGGSLSGPANLTALLHGSAKFTTAGVDFDLAGLSYRPATGNPAPALPTEVSFSGCTGTLTNLSFIDLESDLNVNGNDLENSSIAISGFTTDNRIRVFENTGDALFSTLNISEPLPDAESFNGPEVFDNTIFERIFVATPFSTVCANSTALVSITAHFCDVIDNTITASNAVNSEGVSVMVSSPPQETIPLTRVTANRITGFDCGIVVGQGSGAKVERNAIDDCTVSLEIFSDGNPALGGFAHTAIRDNEFTNAGVAHFMPAGDCRTTQCEVAFAHERDPVDGFPEGPNIHGGPFLAGNSWDDFNGTDADGDGVADTPHTLFDPPGAGPVYRDPFPLVGGPIVVNSSGDEESPPFGMVTLRSALLQADGAAGPDTIIFDIPGTGVKTIRPQSPLPVLRDVTVDGTTQANGIDIDGSDLAAGQPVLKLSGTNAKVVVKGLAILNAPGNGVTIEDALGHELHDCHIGVLRNLAPGAAPGTGNGGFGIELADSDQCLISGCVIGLNAEGGIKLSGESNDGSDENVIANCEIGATGAIDDTPVRIGNFGPGVHVENGVDNRIGGPNVLLEEPEGNVLADNLGPGILLDPINNGKCLRTVIQGNSIGILSRTLDESGSGDFGNFGAGIRLVGAEGTLIGSPTDPAEDLQDRGNEIAYNLGAGVDGAVEGPSRNKFNGVLFNRIFSNSGLGIDWENTGPSINDPNDADAGGTNQFNYPALSFGLANGPDGPEVSELQISLQTGSSKQVVVDVFESAQCDPSGFGEGEQFVVRVEGESDADGIFTATVPFAEDFDPERFYTATATEVTGFGDFITSEFSPCLGPIVVNLESDESDPNPGDGIADVDPGSGGLQTTLRAAIETANALPGRQTIVFDPAVENILIDAANPLVVTDAVIVADDAESKVGIGSVTPDGPPVVLISAVDVAGVELSNLRIDGSNAIGGLVVELRDGGPHELAGVDFVLSDLRVTDSPDALIRDCEFGFSLVQIEESPRSVVGGAAPSEGNHFEVGALEITGPGVRVEGNRFEAACLTLRGITTQGCEVFLNEFDNSFFSPEERASKPAVALRDSASGNRIGDVLGGNTVRGGLGVLIESSCRRNLVEGNTLEPGIDYPAIDLVGGELAGSGRHTPNDLLDADSGANDLQNFPVITALYDGPGDPTRDNLVGFLEARPNTTYEVDFYRTAAPTGRLHGGGVLVHITTLITDATGRADFSLQLGRAAALAGAISATATDPDGNTSEMSPPFNHYRVDSGADTGDPVPGDGLANLAGGPTTLRAAIEAAQEIGADTLIDVSVNEILIEADLPVIDRCHFTISGLESVFPKITDPHAGIRATRPITVEHFSFRDCRTAISLLEGSDGSAVSSCVFAADSSDENAQPCLLVESSGNRIGRAIQSVVFSNSFLVKTGGGVLVRGESAVGNTISGCEFDSVLLVGNESAAIRILAGASGTVVGGPQPGAGNTFEGAVGIELRDVEDTSVVGNTFGDSDAAEFGVECGVQLESTLFTTIEGNLILGVGADESASAIRDRDSGFLTIRDNDIGRFAEAVFAERTASLAVTGNTIGRHPAEARALPNGSGLILLGVISGNISSNTIVACTGDALVLAGACQGIDVTDNAIGGRLGDRSTVDGNGGNGILVDVEGGTGIVIGASATQPPSDPEANHFILNAGAAVRYGPTAGDTLVSGNHMLLNGGGITGADLITLVDLVGAQDRVEVVIDTLNLAGSADPVVVEVYHSAVDCDPPVQGFLSVAREVIAPGDLGGTVRIDVPGIFVLGHTFTATATPAGGITSAFSNCLELDNVPDADDDGSPDGLERLVGNNKDFNRNGLFNVDDPREGVVDAAPIPGGDAIPIAFAGGMGVERFTRSFAIGRAQFPATGLPAPPENLLNVSAAIQFIAEVSPAGGLFEFSFERPPGTNTLYKLIDDAWVPFSFDEASGTGVVPEKTTSEVVVFRIQDGGRGDLDGVANGMVEDPILFAFDPALAVPAHGFGLERFGEEIALFWRSEPGHLYQVQASEDLESFEGIVDPIAGDGSVKAVTHFPRGPRHFYRLLEEAP